MDNKKLKNLVLLLLAGFLISSIVIYAVSFEQFRYETVHGELPSTDFWIGEITEQTEVQQKLVVSADIINSVDIYAGTYGRENSGTVIVTLEDAEGNQMVQKRIAAAQFVDNGFTVVPFDQNIEVARGDILTVKITAEGSFPGNAITIFGGNTYDGEHPMENYSFNGETVPGFLCVRLSGYDSLSFYKIYWVVIAVVFLSLCIYSAHCLKAAAQGKRNFLTTLFAVYFRYKFLLKQLVTRDFKTKYKRSALGMAWSFMNPLLTMGVQYIVFSKLFKSNIPNYPVYLLTGIVFFNFFNEAVTMGMTSITQNASLIKKVYMPKYIYPVSRVMSSLVNFVFALIPLFLMILFTGTPLKASMLLLVFDILCMLSFITGVTLLLTTAMTFFQDTQFLWNVCSMLWLYMTPIFYPESIIPANILPIYRMNPLYQFISFARTCITSGVSPAPSGYIFCLLWAVGMLVLGIRVFKKHQDKFVLFL